MPAPTAEARPPPPQRCPVAPTASCHAWRPAPAVQARPTSTGRPAVQHHHQQQQRDTSTSSSTITITTTTSSISSSSSSSSSGTTRRALLLAGGCATLLPAAAPARAALLQLPAAQLHNRYLLVRAGQSEVEARGTALTNPVWKTGMVMGLSQQGKEQVLRRTVPALRALGVGSEGGGAWVWPSITQSSYQTAEVLAALLGLGRSRLVPEYSFLDMRGVGAWDGREPGAVYDECHRYDRYDPDWRPPPGVDGTPNESVNDLLVRMRQLLSITETQYSGEDVVVVAPDSELLSVLQAAVLGADLRGHAAFGFAPGEVRRLQLAQEGFDDAPRTLPCPRPPACK